MSCSHLFFSVMGSGKASHFTTLLAVSFTLCCLITEQKRKLMLVSVWNEVERFLCSVLCSAQCKCFSLIKKWSIQARHAAKISSHDHCQCQLHTRFLSPVSYLAPTSSSETIKHFTWAICSVKDFLLKNLLPRMTKPRREVSEICLAKFLLESDN